LWMEAKDSARDLTREVDEIKSIGKESNILEDVESGAVDLSAGRSKPHRKKRELLVSILRKLG
jgi:hypothetical protein